MNKILLLVFLFIYLAVLQNIFAADKKVDVVIVGVISHGPMQTTVNAIKEVLAKYNSKITVTWLDLGTDEGYDYAEKNGLTAHMNILINGKYQFTIKGKKIVFQWFEGKQWTKEDLDAVISDNLKKKK